MKIYVLSLQYRRDDEFDSGVYGVFSSFDKAKAYLNTFCSEQGHENLLKSNQVTIWHTFYYTDKSTWIIEETELDEP